MITKPDSLLLISIRSFPAIPKTIYQKQFLINAIKLWNNLPPELKLVQLPLTLQCPASSSRDVRPKFSFFKRRKDHWKRFLWAPHLWVCRLEPSIFIGCITNIDEKRILFPFSKEFWKGFNFKHILKALFINTSWESVIMYYFW